MQLTAIIAEVRYRSGIDPYDAMATDAVLTAFINSALRQVANMRDWDWYVEQENVVTTVGTEAYGLLETVRNVIRVEGVTYPGILRPVTPNQASKFLGETGIPSFWYIQGGSLHLVPTPSKVLTVRYFYSKTESVLTTGTDEPLLPDYAIDLVIVKAAIMVAARTDNGSQHRLLKDEERLIIDQLVDDARRSKAAPIIDSRRDWSGIRGIT